MKIIKHTLLSKLLNRLGYSAISLFGIIFCEEEPDKETIYHETIHYKQQLETLFIGFFLIYAVEYLYWLIRTRNHWTAYHSISFEKEAYMNERNSNYLKHRTKYAWEKYLG